MPVLDGYETVRQLREQAAFDALPILAMTANAMAGERERCLALGMQGHIVKPLDAPALFRTLQAYLPGGVPGHAPGAESGGRPVDTSAAGTPAALHLSAAGSLAAPPVEGLPSIAGLDSARLLAHCDGNVPLARRLLRGFARDYADGVAGWAAWINTDWPALNRAIHTLHGLAGTLGAAALQAEAMLLEAEAQVADAAQARVRLGLVDHQLALLLTTLEQALPQLETGASSTPKLPQPASPAPGGAAGAAIPQRPAGGSAAPSPNTVSPPNPANLAELALLLADSDSRAMDWWQAHEGTLRNSLSPVTLRRISVAMRRFDFDSALQAVLAHQSAGAPQAEASPSTLGALG